MEFFLGTSSSTPLKNKQSVIKGDERGNEISSSTEQQFFLFVRLKRGTSFLIVSIPIAIV